MASISREDIEKHKSFLQVGSPGEKFTAVKFFELQINILYTELFSLANNADSTIRETVAWLLGKSIIHDIQIIECLINLSDDPDRNVRIKASISLDVIDDRLSGTSPSNND